MADDQEKREAYICMNDKVASFFIYFSHYDTKEKSFKDFCELF